MPAADEKSFFKHIISRDMSGAKTALKEEFKVKDEKGRGRYMAARGMISMRENKNVDDGILDDKEKMTRLKKRLTERANSIWCDDFDRGYFDTWVSFINYYRRHELIEAGGKESVNQNPDEQSKHNEAP
jgi:hypothetical protein